MRLQTAKDINQSCGTCEHFIQRSCKKHDVKTHESEKCFDFIPDKPKQLALNVIKTNDEQQLAFGWLYVCRTKDGKQVVDHSGDIVKIETLEKAAYDYVLKERVAGEMHEKDGSEVKPVGAIVESMVFTAEKRAALGIPEGVVHDGMWVGFKVSDKAVWEKIKSGEYKMLSLGSRVLVRELGE